MAKNTFLNSKYKIIGILSLSNHIPEMSFSI